MLIALARTNENLFSNSASSADRGHPFPPAAHPEPNGAYLSALGDAAGPCLALRDVAPARCHHGIAIRVGVEETASSGPRWAGCTRRVGRAPGVRRDARPGPRRLGRHALLVTRFNHSSFGDAVVWNHGCLITHIMFCLKKCTGLRPSMVDVDLELGQALAAKKILELDPKHGGPHVLLSNIYAEYGSWTDAKEVRGVMELQGGGNALFHEFVVGVVLHLTLPLVATTLHLGQPHRVLLRHYSAPDTAPRLLKEFSKDKHDHPPQQTETVAADLPELPLDILMDIFAHLDIPNFVHAGSVCNSGCSAYKELCCLGWYKQSQTPCLLYTSESAGDSIVCLYDIVEKRVYMITLLDPPIRIRLFIGCSLGWLVTADDTSEMHLVNPITGEQIALPSVSTIENVNPIFNEFGDVHKREEKSS
ncbi:hypothetical protein ABZP36_009858 [Zizania latifolia]